MRIVFRTSRPAALAILAASAFVSLAACSGSDSPGGGGGGDAGAVTSGEGGAAARDGGGSGGGGDASAGDSGTVCERAATKLTGCGLSTGGIETSCDTQNACYARCIDAASCAELQGPTTDDNTYTQCLSGC